MGEPTPEDETTPLLDENTTGTGSIKRWLHSVAFFVYLSHFLSAWGDRMWGFAVGLFLIQIAPESLQLTAIYGLSVGGAVLLFGAIIGDWIDRNPRLKAAQVTLVIQNSSVILCAVTICIYMIFRDDISKLLDGNLSTVFHVLIIILSIFAQLASVGNKISIERDWIIEICGRDKEVLANMSAVLRRIDLVTKIVAPIATGQIMGFTNSIIAAIFIAAWNLISMFIEYFLIWKVYVKVPALAVKVYKKKVIADPDNEETALADSQIVGISTEDAEVSNTDKTNKEEESTKLTDESQEEKSALNLDTEVEVIDSDHPRTSRSCRSFCSSIFQSFIVLYKGWRTYIKYRVAYAGVALAFLYMTVLGFDNVTTGYAYSQGMSEWVLGLIMAGGAVIGIIGTVIYPILRRRIGLERTGLFSIASEIVCLSLCVLSVFAPGSPFDPLYYIRDDESTNLTSYTNWTSLSESDSNSEESFWQNTTSSSPGNATNPEDGTSVNKPESYLSLILLLLGIVLARFGLWISDLAITQLFLEQVDETERGVVNGVQDSINKLMDMLKFGLVVALPTTPTFGYLIIISFIFICLGFVLFAIYSRKVRGHLMPHIKFSRSEPKSNNPFRDVVNRREKGDASLPIPMAT